MAVKVTVVAVTAVLLVAALPHPAAHATAYQVGESAGWTSADMDIYKQWAATKTFHLGDVLGTPSLSFSRLLLYFFELLIFFCEHHEDPGPRHKFRGLNYKQ